MRKSYLFLITLIFFSISKIYASWFPIDSLSKSIQPLNQKSNINTFEKNINSSSNFSITSNIKAVNLTKGKIKVGPRKSQLKKLNFINLKIFENETYTHELGKPKIPTFSKWVEYSGDIKNIKITIENNHYEKVNLNLYSNNKIIPVQHSVVKLPGRIENTPIQYNKNFYNQSIVYPQKDYIISNTIQIRGKKFALITFYPIKYNPKQNVLHVNKNLEVYFSIENLKIKIDNSFNFNKLYENKILNYDKVNTYVKTANHLDTMLIVVGDKYKNELKINELVQLKKDIGFNVIRKNISQIGNSDLSLRNYIKNLYNSTNPKLAYVLLIGDVDDVPTHNGTTNGNNQATDHYYKAIDTNDYTSDIGGPDIFVGRLTMNNSNELHTIINKILRYQRILFNDLSWVKLSSTVATDDRYTIAEGTHNFVIDNYLIPMNHQGNYPNVNNPGADKLYYVAHGARTTNLIHMFKEGRTIINYSGHGSYTYWAGPEFKFEHMEKMNHPDALPFVVSNACITNTYARSSDCFGEMWLKYSNGAIAFWGASNNSYWDEDDVLEKEMYRSLYQDRSHTLGHITTAALLDVWRAYNGSNRAPYYMEIYNITGDPSIQLLTQIPKKLELNMDEQHFDGIELFPVKVMKEDTPIQNAHVTISNNNGLHRFYLTNENGIANIKIAEGENEVNEFFYISAYMHNSIPTIARVQTIANNRSYLIKNSVQIIDNENQILNPNEQAEIILKVKNVGNKKTGVINALLTSLSPSVEILGSKKINFSNIEPGQTGVSLNSISIVTKKNISDQEKIKIKVDWNNQFDNSTGSFVWPIEVRSPDLIIENITYREIEGNQNNIIEANEKAEVEFDIKNIGGYVLKKDDTYLTLTSNIQNITFPISELFIDNDVEINQNFKTIFPFNVGSVENGITSKFSLNVYMNAKNKSFETLKTIGTKTTLILKSSDPFPIIIPDNNSEGIISQIVSDKNFNLKKISIHVKISHTYIGDLNVTLISPSGLELKLHNRGGRSNDNIDLWYGEDGTPVDSLDPLYRENTTGTWSIKISDHAVRDEGKLENFEIKFEGHLR